MCNNIKMDELSDDDADRYCDVCLTNDLAREAERVFDNGDVVWLLCRTCAEAFSLGAEQPGGGRLIDIEAYREGVHRPGAKAAIPVAGLPLDELAEKITDFDGEVGAYPMACSYCPAPARYVADPYSLSSRYLLCERHYRELRHIKRGSAGDVDP